MKCKKTKFHNADGSLTLYSFACGYIQERGGVKLFKDGIYWHIRTMIGGRYWETVDTLGEARVLYRARIKWVKDYLKLNK